MSLRYVRRFRVRGVDTPGLSCIAITRWKLFSDNFPLKSAKPRGNNAARTDGELQVIVMLNLNEARDLARDFYGVRRHNGLFPRDIR